jgi:cysteine synthase A
MTAILAAVPQTWEEFTSRLGWTPLVPVRTTLRGRSYTLLLKLEGMNPFGSIKDRTAYGLLREEERGRTGRFAVVESTSGNLGVALAALCRFRGHTFIAVVDPKVQNENLALMAHFGAEILMVNDADGNDNYLAARLSRVRELLEEDPTLTWTNQYDNVANPLVHSRRTGPEILQQAGSTDAIFVPVSTGGIVAGVNTYIRHASPATRVVAVDLVGSAAIGGDSGPRHLTGIGANLRSRFALKSDLGDRIWVRDVDAVAVCRKLKAETGLDVGGSSGATIAACLSYLGDHPYLSRPVCVCPDSGWKYWDSIYNDGWADRNGLDLAAESARIDNEGIQFTCSNSM